MYYCNAYCSVFIYEWRACCSIAAYVFYSGVEVEEDLMTREKSTVDKSDVYLSGIKTRSSKFCTLFPAAVYNITSARRHRATAALLYSHDSIVRVLRFTLAHYIIITILYTPGVNEKKTNAMTFSNRRSDTS